jgi:hypothetical protein
MNSIIDILPKLERAVQQKFLSILFSTIIVMCGKVNFRNLSRYSEISERTYRRQFSRSQLHKGNAEIIKLPFCQHRGRSSPQTAHSSRKVAKQTYGIEYFYNGSAGKAEKGLEISVIAVVDAVDRKQGYPLSVQQTPAQPRISKDQN